MAFYHKAHRSVLRITGEGALQFLHDILSADCLSVPAGGMRQGCLLSPQGRILAEMVLYPNGPDDVYLDIDESQAEDTLKKLRLYRLRRPLTLSREEDLHVIACLDEVPAMAPIIELFIFLLLFMIIVALAERLFGPKFVLAILA